jgi:hypothetical protein
MIKILIICFSLQLISLNGWSKIDEESLERITKIINSFPSSEDSCAVSAAPLGNQEIELSYYDNKSKIGDRFQIGKQFYLIALPGKNNDFYIKLNTPTGYLNQKKILIHLVVSENKFVIDQLSIRRNLKDSPNVDVFYCSRQLEIKHRVSNRNRGVPHSQSESPTIDLSALIGEFLIGAAEFYVEAQGRNPIVSSFRRGLVSAVPSLVIAVYQQIKSDLKEDMKKCQDRGLVGDPCHEFLLDPFSEAKEKLHNQE